jgi:hypothetical protein
MWCKDRFRYVAVSVEKQASSKSKPFRIPRPGILSENQTFDLLDRDNEIGIAGAFTKRYGRATNILARSLTVSVVLASLIPILWETGVGAEVMKTNCRSHRGWHDHLNDSRSDLSACVLCPYERKGPQARKAEGRTESRRELRGRTAMKVTNDQPVSLVLDQSRQAHYKRNRHSG